MPISISNRRQTVYTFAGATLGLGTVLWVLSLTSCRAAESKAHTLPFAPCPDSPNCVSTVADPDDNVHYMAPLTYQGAVTDVHAKLLAIIEKLPRTTVIEQRTNYLHVEFRSLIFRFVDDVEFYIDENAGLVHFRSASRLGYSDLGVNRKRMEKIGELLRKSGA